MVRLESKLNQTLKANKITFTFQYGQIRKKNANLLKKKNALFTFQYGQIRKFLFNACTL